MPLPLVHLMIAHELLELGACPVEEDAHANFYLGAISPDAIHMREGSSRDDKRRIHLFADQDSLAVRMSRIDAFTAERIGDTDVGMLFGWTSHIAADAVWSLYVMHNYWDHCLDNEPRDVRTKHYYMETDKIEYEMFRSFKWRESVWEEIARSTPTPMHSLLTAEEIARWRDRYLRWHAEIGEEPSEAPQYFTMERTEAFVAMAVQCCTVGFRSSFTEARAVIEEQYAEDYIANVGRT